MPPSTANSITKDEFINWLKNALLFTLSADLAFLMALQGSLSQGRLLPNQQDLIFAVGAFYSAILSAVIGLIKTYMTDNTKASSSIHPST